MLRQHLKLRRKCTEVLSGQRAAMCNAIFYIEIQIKAQKQRQRRFGLLLRLGIFSLGFDFADGIKLCKAAHL